MVRHDGELVNQHAVLLLGISVGIAHDLVDHRRRSEPKLLSRHPNRHHLCFVGQIASWSCQNGTPWLRNTKLDCFVGQGGYGYALSEFSLHKEEVTGFLAPILDEGNAFILMNGTMRGKKNQLFQMYQANKDNPDWFCEWLTPEITKRYCWVGDDMNLNPELLGQQDPLTGKQYLNVQDRVNSKMISYSLARQEYLNEMI